MANWASLERTTGSESILVDFDVDNGHKGIPKSRPLIYRWSQVNADDQRTKIYRNAMNVDIFALIVELKAAFNAASIIEEYV